ncbi:MULTISPECIES: sensor histidine kinase [Bacillaceae]|uniref:sensor histidine kinase n=1 Tax=Bacillaceae TaxID=186817 RepID=UPI001E356008|nr:MULTISPECIES: sensor histidine kinase [Bacillaceae]MCE4049354.1 sensor histidine kinase [Bacillus sp. Au-Bac7]MCM3032375.1 sensor histidine kinase [Niallia sp. MER 6]
MKLKQTGRFQQKMFNKLFLTSSITIIVTVIILIVTITNYYSEIIIQKEVNVNTRTIERVEDYFSAKDSDVNKAIRDIYVQGDLIDDISFALHNGYGKYLEYRLNRFTEDHSYFPSNLDTYFNGFFSQDSDINAISLRSLDSHSVEYLLINNYLRWNESMKNAEVTENKPEANLRSAGLPKGRRLKDTITKKVVINNPVTLEKIGEISIFYSTEHLDKMVQKDEGAPASFFLLDAEGKTIYSHNEGVPSAIIQQFKQETNETKLSYKSKKFYINTVANKGDYTFVSVITNEGWQKLSIVRGTMWVVIILLIVAAILMSYTFMQNYSRRINKIVSTIRQVEKGNLAARIPASDEEDELAKIAFNINSMLDELNNYIAQFYLLNLKQQQAELKALQAQINPHFLFNTLEAIRMVAMLEGSKTSSKMTFHLSKLFRYSLESKDIVPLYTEIEYVKQYLTLMQFKHPDKLEVQFHLAEEVEQTPVQKLILQPIIENYFVHGFKKDRTDNLLTISGVKLGEKIEIRIDDNGKGMSEEKLSQIVHHINCEEGDEMKSIGLRNIHQRLKLKYGDQYGLSVKSSPAVGTTVILTIPVQGIYHV